MKYLIVVDMQNDFIWGSLGTEEAKSIVPEVKKAIENFSGEIIFTRDTHTVDYLNTQEGRKLPVEHCIKGTWGWEITDELKEYTCDKKIFDKPTFGSLELIDYLKEKGDVESVTLLGLCTDICVISNAFLVKAAFPEVNVSVLKDASRGVSMESHERALAQMAVCQIDVL